MAMRPTPHSPAFEAHVRFLTDLARRLHLAGVQASRLEGAVRSVANAIGVTCEIWATPTGILLAMSDPQISDGPQHTRLLRLELGDIDLRTLAGLDRIAEDVVAGRLSLAEAQLQMAQLGAGGPPPLWRQVQEVGAFGMAAAAVAGLLAKSWMDISVAGVLGLMIGWLVMLSNTRPHLRDAVEAVAALIATALATAFAHFVAPLSLEPVVVSALIVLMPGLTLTTAVSELASHQLVAGSTRLAGALTVLLKLTFGSVAATHVLRVMGWTPQALVDAAVLLPRWVEVIATLAASASFAVLFRATTRDVPLVMGSAILGYVITRVTGAWFGGAVSGATFAGGAFFSSLVIAALANLYGRLANRPGALVRVPGIMLLVPGSVGFRALGFVMERDYAVGFDTLVAVLSAILALVAGLLFGSLLIPPRRYL